MMSSVVLLTFANSSEKLSDDESEEEEESENEYDSENQEEEMDKNSKMLKSEDSQKSSKSTKSDRSRKSSKRNSMEMDSLLSTEIVFSQSQQDEVQEIEVQEIQNIPELPNDLSNAGLEIPEELNENETPLHNHNHDHNHNHNHSHNHDDENTCLFKRYQKVLDESEHTPYICILISHRYIYCICRGIKESIMTLFKERYSLIHSFTHSLIHSFTHSFHRIEYVINCLITAHHFRNMILLQRAGRNYSNQSFIFFISLMNR